MDADTDWPIQAKLEVDLSYMSAIINRRIGSFNSDVSDSRFTEYLKQLCIEMVDRKYDKQINRETEIRTIYNPHDYLYNDERNYLKSIGKILGHSVVGKVVF